jgi:hypothetical protein
MSARRVTEVSPIPAKFLPKTVQKYAVLCIVFGLTGLRFYGCLFYEGFWGGAYYNHHCWEAWNCCGYFGKLLLKHFDTLHQVQKQLNYCLWILFD